MSRSGQALCALALASCLLLAACDSGSGGRPGTSAGSVSRTAPVDGAEAGDPPAPTLAAGQHATVTYCNHEQARITEPPVLHGPRPGSPS